jgi:hypothetical protein
MSKMNDLRWYLPLRKLFEAAVAKYQEGRRDAEAYFDAKGRAYLASIGQTAQEIYDFAEDHARGGEPDWETVLLISAVRRDYFVVVQKHIPSKRVIDMAALPPKEAALDGIGWLPRLIEKAEAKLRGEMPADLMYDCGGDRQFFEKHGRHPADFLRVTWAAKGDSKKILRYVRG